VKATKLASNENPFGPSPKALAAMRTALAQCHRYPDDRASKLKERLAEFHSVSAEQIIIGAGLTALLETIAHTFLSPGLNALTSECSFVMYSIATQASGAMLRTVPMRQHSFDLRAIAAAVDSSTGLIFIANPNNPTGTIVTAAQMDEFLTLIPAHITLVLDEAYYEFAQHFAAKRAVEYSHSLNYVRGGRNVLVLRTFSKAYGLAGVRVGYAIGPSDLISRLTRIRTIYSVSSVAQAGALAALDDEAYARKTVENNATESDRVTASLSELGFPLTATWTNFMYCEIGRDADELAAKLQNTGILVCPLSSWGAPNAIRLTIGTPAQNQDFLRTFKKVMAKNGVAH